MFSRCDYRSILMGIGEVRSLTRTEQVALCQLCCSNKKPPPQSSKDKGERLMIPCMKGNSVPFPLFAHERFEFQPFQSFHGMTMRMKDANNEPLSAYHYEAVHSSNESEVDGADLSCVSHWIDDGRHRTMYCVDEHGEFTCNKEFDPYSGSACR